MHHALHGIIHQPMTHDESLAFEAFRNDFHRVMSPARRSAGMSGMQVGIIADLEPGRLERRLQQAADALHAVVRALAGTHASSWICLPSIKVWITTKAKN